MLPAAAIPPCSRVCCRGVAPIQGAWSWLVCPRCLRRPPLVAASPCAPFAGYCSQGVVGCRTGSFQRAGSPSTARAPRPRGAGCWQESVLTPSRWCACLLRRLPRRSRSWKQRPAVTPTSRQRSAKRRNRKSPRTKRPRCVRRTPCLVRTPARPAQSLPRYLFEGATLVCVCLCHDAVNGFNRF